jgi:hypothetical protein
MPHMRERGGGLVVNISTVDPAAFQGIHARYVLVIIDEAGGVPKSIFDAVDALATNIDARVVVGREPRRSCIAFRHDLQAGLRLARRDDQRLRHAGVHRGRRSPRSCYHCSSRRSGWKNASSAGESTVRSTNPRFSASSLTFRRLFDLAEVDRGGAETKPGTQPPSGLVLGYRPVR